MDVITKNVSPHMATGDFNVATWRKLYHDWVQLVLKLALLVLV